MPRLIGTVSLLALLAGSPVEAAPRVETLPAAVAAIDARGIVLLRDGSRHRPGPAGQALRLDPAPQQSAAQAPPDLLPQSSPAAGTRDIALAWLARPTARYAHGVLGDGLEAAALRVRDRAGRAYQVDLADNAVFEDLTPRLADLNGDGRDEVMVVRSTLDRGAALAIYGLRGDALAEVAATPPIGRAHRWMNPVGAADLDGDGKVEIMAVETPHIGGILRAWHLDAGKLRLVASLSGVSNHAIGYTALALHAIVDWDGDGRPDVILPDQARTALQVLSFDGKAFRDIARIGLPGPVSTAIATVDGALLLGTVNGVLARVRP